MHQKIENCCTQQVLNELHKKKHLFTKPNDEVDDIVFLKLLISKYSSRTVYTSRNIIKNIRTMKLSDFDNNVTTLYEHLGEEINRLTTLGFTHDHLLMDVFDILKTSTNEEFFKDIKDEEKKYERGQDMDWTDLMDHAIDVYTDLVDKNQWNVKDPRDERIMSLATIIQKMVAFTSVPNSDPSNPRKNNRKFRAIDDCKFVCQCNDETKIVNGTTYYWCLYHYECGMWTTHKPATCGRETSHVPSKYDKATHEAQWNKKFNTPSNVSTTSSNQSSTSSNKKVQYQLDSKL